MVINLSRLKSKLNYSSEVEALFLNSTSNELFEMAGPMDRIKALDAIEKDIINCLQTAGTALTELSREKTSQKQVENNTHQFLKALGSVESKLTDQINYLTQVSTGQPHEGSGYASQKVLQMAWHRLQHAKTRINELEKLRNKNDKTAAVEQPVIIKSEPQTIKSEPR